MLRRARIVTWNGKDVPTELRDLPAGRYMVEPVEEEAPTLSPEEEAGIEAALDRTARVASLTPNAPRDYRCSPQALKVTYTEEAVADIVEAITYLNERNPTAAANLDADITRCVERLAAREFEGPVSRLRSGAVVRSCVILTNS
jgi:hypothetical protein